MKPRPSLTEFQLDIQSDNIAHLVFDMPGRSVNVFTNAAIHEAEAVADWLPGSGVGGLLISSGKSTGFCVGADLSELADAYAMIIRAPEAERSQVGRDHFAPIGRAFRKLETAGVPVAVAINGLALGGGCEFALTAHHRVLADTPGTALGLPESLVGLLPGGGGTQRMPRLVGLEASLPVLLDGRRLGARDAVASGAAQACVPAGQEVEAALTWLRGRPALVQPWDEPGWRRPSPAETAAALGSERTRRLAETRGHYPAITAILDCVEHGLPLSMDQAVAEELRIFGELIKRPEPRDMIRSLFLGRQAFGKRSKAGTLPPALDALKADVAAALATAADALGRTEAEAAGREAGFTKPLPRGPAREGAPRPLPDVDPIAPTGLWFEAPSSDWERRATRLLGAAAAAAAAHRGQLNDDEQKLADFAIVEAFGFPAYLGGPFALLDSVGSVAVARMAAA